jgi:GntR family transcriptional regulator, transcriptional repressor for pyruvate dehydrogenase complex
MVDLTTSTSGAYGPAFEAITYGRPFEEVASQIRQRLLSGILKTDDRLPPERVLAAQFGISRNTLRQALRSLQTMGLLEVRSGKSGGAFVRNGGGDAVLAGLSDLTRLGVIQPEHLREARAVLSTSVASFAAQRRTGDDIDALSQNVDAGEAAARSGDFLLREKLGFEFQRLLARATKNPVFVIFTDAVIELNEELARRYGAPSHRLVLPRRRAIFECVRDAQATEAASAMRAFLVALERFYVGQRKTLASGKSR